MTWSQATIGGVALDEFAKFSRYPFDETHRRRIDHDVRRAAYFIIEGKAATYYGVGATHCPGLWMSSFTISVRF